MYLNLNFYSNNFNISPWHTLSSFVPAAVGNCYLTIASLFVDSMVLVYFASLLCGCWCLDIATVFSLQWCVWFGSVMCLFFVVVQAIFSEDIWHWSKELHYHIRVCNLHISDNLPYNEELWQAENYLIKNGKTRKMQSDQMMLCKEKEQIWQCLCFVVLACQT